MRECLFLYDSNQLDDWPRPDEGSLAERVRPRYRAACAALTAVLTGEMGLMQAAHEHSLCHKRLRSMVHRAPVLANDGLPYGYRVCVPWGTYHRGAPALGEAEMPRAAGPHAMGQLLAAQPTVCAWVDAFGSPLPPGRPPKTFDRLHTKIVAELKRLDLGDYYPLNQLDQGRRALLRFIRQRRIDTIVVGNLDDSEAVPTKMADFCTTPFSRSELDGHKIDIEAVLGMSMPNGGLVKRSITTLWLLVEIEVQSRAILGWVLRVGPSYNNLDVSSCIARSLRPWSRRDLTIPSLEYAPGAGMPSGLLESMSSWRVRSIAMDNAMAHAALDFEQGFCRAHGGMLIFGKAHEPRSRPIIEQFFSRLERGALREIPGGFEPATRLGKNKIRISNFAPGDCPIQLHLFEELLDVITANYNATPHPALGNLTPLQFLQMQKQRAFDFVPDSGEADANDMGSVLIPLKVHGDRSEGLMPHVNYMYVRYRSAELDGKWELVGKTLLARICRHDLRTFVLMRSATAPLCVMRAAAPWNRTAHDETTRALIMQWSKQRVGFSVVGAECAIAAYVAFLRSSVPISPKAVNEFARLQQIHRGVLPSSRSPRIEAPVKVPSSGWVSLDDELDL